MKIDHFVVFFYSFALVASGSFALKLANFSRANSDCPISSDFWKMIKWFYGPSNYVSINLITKTSEFHSTLSHRLSNIFLKELTKGNYIHCLKQFASDINYSTCVQTPS